MSSQSSFTADCVALNFQRVCGGNHPSGYTYGCRNVFCFFCLSPIQRGLLATYRAPILTAFETKDVNRCPHTDKRIRISAQGILQVAKRLKWVLSRAVCSHATAWAVWIVSWPSRHPKDVPFVSEFRWGTYSLGAIRPQRTPTFGKMSTFGSTKLNISTSLARRRHMSIQLHSLYCSVSPQIHCNASSFVIVIKRNCTTDRYTVFSCFTVPRTLVTAHKRSSY